LILARSALLKAGATVLTLVATVASAVYVTGHLKNPAAPLRPTVLTSTQISTVSLPGGGQVTLTPGVQPATIQPVTSTYAS
jgi:hypothetical protein